MKIFEAINFGKDSLKNLNIGKIEIEKILIESIKKDRLYIILNQEKSISEDNLTKFKYLISRRKNGEPLEYILNRVSFYSEEFFIQKGALIPRPETELLIDKTVETLKKLKNPKVLEIGVGSGIISVMLAKLIPDIKIVAVDVSLEALNISKINIEKFGVSEKIELRQSDLFENLDKNEKFDLIVSNPPYISNSEKGKLQTELDYEPEIALYGGNIGDEILQKIVTSFLSKTETKYLICEMGYDQKEKIINFVDNKTRIEFYRDLAEFDRGFILTKIKDI